MDLEATPSTLQSGTELEATPSTPTIESSSGGAQSPPPNLPAKKKRALPVTDPDVEVISLPPKMLLATNRFVCEVCNKGFQREQNLQLHRRGHNLPWKGKQKDPLQAQRQRLYTCSEPTCAHHDPARAFGDLTGIRKHFCRKHGEKKWKCHKCGKRYAVQSTWKAHSKICGTREYRCDCGTLFSRRGSFITHRAFCDALAQESAHLPPTGHLYGAANAVNTALSLSQPGSHLASPFGVVPHGHFQDPCTEQAMVLLQMSATSLLQRAAQMGDTSSSSSLMSSNQAIIERVVGQQDDIKRRLVDDKHVGIIRRASEKHDIMELIMSQGPCSKRFIVICITGGHGLGKTNLASLVYWDYSICRYFETRVWLCLSDACDYEELLRNVVASITGVSCRLNERGELEELLKEELMGKKFLLVLDNLCENNVEVCRHILPLLSMGDKGSAVMVTTNSNLIPVHLGSTYAYYLTALSYDSFLTLAKPTSIEYSPLGSIIDKIPSWCSGYPMFAKAICGILYSAFTQKCLDDTVESRLTEIFRKPDNHLRHLLYLSYSYLLPNQKMCLLFLSMFPRDYTYSKEKCLRLWMSQGFIIPEKEKDRQDNCEDVFDELLHGSFFDYSPSSEVTEQKYVMHELSSDLARTASGNKFFRAHDQELHRIPKDVHHLSIVPKQCDSEIYFSSFTEIRDLRTFLLVYNSHSQFHVMDGKALDECFRNFKCLKTLDLSHTDIRELPESIGCIPSLCFLGLNNTSIRRLPDSICNLFNLQTLELQNSVFLVELPNGIRNLNCLYHLDASKECGPIYIPPGIGQLTNLRTLTTFTVGGVSWNCKASELAHLNSLEGFLHIRSLNNVENAEDAKWACLAAKKLKKLSLEWCHGGEDIESDDQISVAEHVLDALKPHSLLGELSIKGYYGRKFPSWIADHALSDLVSITLDNCYNCDKLPPLGALPFLRCLFIQNLRGVQLIGCEFWTCRINDKSFLKLEILRLRDMYNLEYYDMLDGDFPSLCSLSIERCPKLKSIPRFHFISDISIMSCNKLSLPGLQSLKSLKIGNMRQRTCFALPFGLHSLQMLEVMCCEHLSSVEGLSGLQSLKNLKFRTCPRLNFIQDEPLPDTLETIDIHNNCYSLSKWRPHGFEELHDASEVYRKFIRRKCVGKGVNDAMMHEPEGDHTSISTLTE